MRVRLPEHIDEMSVRSAVDAALVLLARDLDDRCRPRLGAVWAVRAESSSDPAVWLRELALPGSPAAGVVGPMRAQTLADLREAEQARRDLHEVRVRYDADRGVAALVVLGRLARTFALPCRDDIVAMAERLRGLEGRAGRIPLTLGDYAALMHHRDELRRRLDVLAHDEARSAAELEDAARQLVFARYEVEFAADTTPEEQRERAGQLIEQERRVAGLELAISTGRAESHELAAALDTLQEHLFFAVPTATPLEAELFAHLTAAADGLLRFFGVSTRTRPGSDARRIGDVIEGWAALGEGIGLTAAADDGPVGRDLLGRTVHHFEQFVSAALDLAPSQPWLADIVSDVEIVLNGLHDAATMLVDVPPVHEQRGDQPA